MSLRPFFAIFTLVAACIIYARLIYSELACDPEVADECHNDIAPTKVRAQQIVRREDPLLDMAYVSSEREKNFARFGMPADMAKATAKRAKTIDQGQEGARLRQLLGDAAEPVQLADALCGTSNQSRPRYAALRFFVAEKGGGRMAIQLSRTGQIRMQAWADASPIDQIYSSLELTDGREDNATLMGVAAVMADAEEEALEREPPWGSSRGIMKRWSWEGVQKRSPGIKGKLIAYFALMHVAVEYANQDGGLCND
jgi:hypothetical protein